ncbi:MAG: cobalt ECF transporter T component CbiQ [Thermoguttaceae bacterium]|jgi:cobalt/nickel transport system permease protein
MHHLDEWAETDPACGRCDIRVRLLLAVAAILAIVVSTRIWLPLGAAACSFAFLAASRTRLGELAARLAGPVAVAVLVVLLEGLMTGTTPAATLELGPCRLVATEEGLRHGSLVAARVLGSIGILLVLCRAAAAERIFAALRWARVPRTWIEIAMLMHRYTFTLFDSAAGILAAQKTRLGHARVGRSLRSLGSLTGTVVLRAIDQAQRTHEAMVVRGYNGSLPIPRLAPLAWRDLGVLAAGLAAVAAALGLAEGLLP